MENVRSPFLLFADRTRGLSLAIRHRAVVATTMAVGLIVFVRLAWMGDDAFICLRVVDNFVNGYGLRWNVAERVQAFTNPLWVLLLTVAYSITREPFYTTLAISFFFWMGTLFVATRQIARGPLAALVAASALLFSRAVTEHGAGGLETALSYFLIAKFVERLLSPTEKPHQVFALTLFFSLALVNRLDNLWLLLPPLGYGLWKHRGSPNFFGWLALGLSPLFAWELFALVYYGNFLPGPYYAKVLTGINRGEYLGQGLLYFINFARFDPLGVIVIFTAVATGLLFRNPKTLALTFGILSHLIYVLWVGGDFMAGRFFSTTVLSSTFALLSLKLERRKSLATIITAAGLLIALGLRTNGSQLTASSSRHKLEKAGIADERAWYVPYFGLTTLSRNDLRVAAPSGGRRVVATTLIGLGGFQAGPEAHFIDLHSLADPLLSRLPASYNATWRIGHFKREVPEGYPESALAGKNWLKDPALGVFWEKVMLITRGDLFTKARWGAILSMNLGRYDQLVDKRRYRYGGHSVRLAETQAVVRDSAASNASGLTPMGQNGLLIEMGSLSHAPRVELSADRSKNATLVFLKGDQEVGIAPLPAAAGLGILTRTIQIPRPAQTAGFDAIAIRPQFNAFPMAFGHLRVFE